MYKQQGTAQEEAHIQEWHLTWVLKDGLKVIEIVDSMGRHEPRASCWLNGGHMCRDYKSHVVASE